ncbi:hypothetical protein [Halobaculum lipolyticum]|nr:hypothetical protein [Halobaculum sp. DT31]
MLETRARAGLREIGTKAMYDDATGGHETPEREDAPLTLRTDCPDCGRALADHGLTSAGPGRTTLAPCGFDVAAVTLREVATALDDSARRLAADGGTAEKTLTLDADGLEVPADVDVTDGVVFRARGATIDVKPRGSDLDRYPLLDRRSLEAHGQRVENEHIGIREVTVKPYGEDPRTYRVEVAEDGGGAR